MKTSLAIGLLVVAWLLIFTGWHRQEGESFAGDSPHSPLDELRATFNPSDQTTKKTTATVQNGAHP